MSTHKFELPSVPNAFACQWRVVVPSSNGNKDRAQARLSLLKSSIPGHPHGTMIRATIFCVDTGYQLEGIAKLNNSYWYFLGGVSHAYTRDHTYYASYFVCDEHGAPTQLHRQPDKVIVLPAGALTNEQLTQLAVQFKVNELGCQAPP